MADQSLQAVLSTALPRDTRCQVRNEGAVVDLRILRDCTRFIPRFVFLMSYYGVTICVYYDQAVSEVLIVQLTVNQVDFL